MNNLTNEQIAAIIIKINALWQRDPNDLLIYTMKDQLEQLGAKVDIVADQGVVVSWKDQEGV